MKSAKSIPQPAIIVIVHQMAKRSISNAISGMPTKFSCSLMIMLLFLTLPTLLQSATQPVHEIDWITEKEDADTASSEIFTFSHTPDPNIDLWGLLKLKLYVSKKIKTVKGIYCYVPGWQGSSMVMIKNKSLRNYVNQKQFALITFTMEGEYTSKDDKISKWSGDAFDRGLQELAIKSNHPEIANAPLLFNGHSAGGQFGYHFTLQKPDRVIAFVTIKGGLHSLVPAGEAARVPGFMVIGEKDEEFRQANLKQLFTQNLAKGAPWTFAIHPDSKHNPVDDTIKHAFFDAVIPLRMGKTATSNGISNLRPVTDTSGWIGNLSNYSIAHHQEYVDEKYAGTWLPDENFARVWLNFVSK